MASRSLILLLLRLRCDNMGQSWRAPRPLLILLSLSSNRLSFGNLGKPLSVVRPTLIKLSDSKLTYSSLRPSICVARALSRFSSSIWKEKVQFYCNLSTFLHFLPPHNNAALSYILTGGTRLTRLWRIWPSRYKLCYKRTKPPYCHTPSQTKFPFPTHFIHFIYLKKIFGTMQRISISTDWQNHYCKVGEKLFNCMRQLIDNTVHLSLPCFSAWEFYRSLYVCDWRPSPAHGGSSLGKID